MFTTITTPERDQCGVSRLPDAPDMTSTELKREFDSLGNLAVDKFIQHIDEISADTAADNIGAAIPDGIIAAPRIQPIIEAMVDLIQGNTTAINGILNTVYPVGTIYSTTSDTFDPGTEFGGTWTEYTWTGDTSGLHHFEKTAE